MAKTIRAVFGADETTIVIPQWQYDYNTVLQFDGLDLPLSYEVDLSNSKTGQSVTVRGDENGCVIPAQFFIPGTSIYAWIYLVGNTYGYTRAQVEIPISPRAEHTGEEPTPAQQSALDEAIAALNEAEEAMSGIVETLPETLAGKVGFSDIHVEGSSIVEAVTITDGEMHTVCEMPTIGAFDLIAARAVPSGGTTGQVLAKRSNTDYAMQWVDQSGGGGGGGAVDSVNGKTGEVVLDASDVGALPSDTSYVSSVNGSIGAVTVNVPTKTSDLQNDSGFITSAPVTSVNSKTGAVTLNASDVGAGTYSKPSGGIPSSDMASAVQTSLGKADTAYQKPSGGIPGTDLASGVIPTVPSAYTSNPAALGTASAGSSTSWAKGDHVHPKPSAGDIGAIAAPATPSAGDVLTYSSGAWAAAAPAHQIPPGGNAGETLAKNSSTDYDLRWRTINDWTPAGLMRTNGGTAAKVAEWSFWSATQYPAWLVVTVGNSNTYAGALTLKVNGSTAYPIYINGAASSATNYSLPAGSYFVYFDGSKFDFRTDGKIPGDIIGHADKDIQAPASPSVGDFLVYSANGWAAQSLSTWQGGNY